LSVIRELPDNFYFPQAHLLITPNLPLRQRKLNGHLTPRTVSVQETICSPGRPQYSGVARTTALRPIAFGLPAV